MKRLFNMKPENAWKRIFYREMLTLKILQYSEMNTHFRRIRWYFFFKCNFVYFWVLMWPELCSSLVRFEGVLRPAESDPAFGATEPEPALKRRHRIVRLGKTHKEILFNYFRFSRLSRTIEFKICLRPENHFTFW